MEFDDVVCYERYAEKAGLRQKFQSGIASTNTEVMTFCLSEEFEQENDYSGKMDCQLRKSGYNVLVKNIAA